jgi:hypothetical protein
MGLTVSITMAVSVVLGDGGGCQEAAKAGHEQEQQKRTGDRTWTTNHMVSLRGRALILVGDGRTVGYHHTAN